MNNQNESALTIPYVKVGDYYFPNLSSPPDAGDIGFWGRRRKEFLRELNRRRAASRLKDGVDVTFVTDHSGSGKAL